MAVNIPIPVPLSPGVAKRFYEAVIFLHSLIAVNFKNKTTVEPDLDTATGKSPKDEFHCFVNKLAQICDDKRGGHDDDKREVHGDTITAFALLQPGSVQYRFASNRRNTVELESVKTYITDILKTLGDTPDDQLDAVHNEILDKVVTFNRPRIEHYIKELKKQLDFCIDACRRECTSLANTIAEGLENLQRLANHVAGTGLTDKQFATSALPVLNLLSTLYNTTTTTTTPSSSTSSPFAEYIRRKSRLDTLPNTRSPFSELRHALGRLHSYNIAISVLLSVRRHHHSLFEDFTVVYIPSRAPSEPPNIRRTPEGITRRMGTDILAAYRSHASYLEGIGLSGAIQKAAKGQEFQPIVHCEVNLLDSILNPLSATTTYQGGTLRDAEEGDDGQEADLNPYDEAPRFYGEAQFGRYIGTSKPTCQLCALYFQNHPAAVDVQVRQSHCNVYYKWRVPDMFDAFHGQGGIAMEMARKKREDILEGMIKGVRNLVLQAFITNGGGGNLGVGVGVGGGGALMGRVVRKAHDSFTTPSNPYPMVVQVGAVGVGQRVRNIEAGHPGDADDAGGAAAPDRNTTYKGGDDLAERFGGLGI